MQEIHKKMYERLAGENRQEVIGLLNRIQAQQSHNKKNIQQCLANNSLVSLLAVAHGTEQYDFLEECVWNTLDHAQLRGMLQSISMLSDEPAAKKLDVLVGKAGVLINTPPSSKKIK